MAQVRQAVPQRTLAPNRTHSRACRAQVKTLSRNASWHSCAAAKSAASVGQMEFAEIRLPRPSLSRPGSQARMGRSVSFSNEEQVYPQRQPTAQPTPPESPEMLRRPRTTPPDTPETSFKGGTAGLPPQTSPLAVYSATAAELGAIVGGPSRSLQQLQRLVSFEVEAETRWGDTVVLVGSTPQLGSWVPDAGLPLQTDERTYPAWRLPPISLKEGVEYVRRRRCL